VFNELNVLLGLLCGWRVIGTRVGGGIAESFGIGLTGAAALVFGGVFLQSFNTMLDNALRRKYDGPFEGLVAVFNIGVEYGAILLNGTVIGIIVIGGIATGLAANWIHARLRGGCEPGLSIWQLRPTRDHAAFGRFRLGARGSGHVERLHSGTR